MDNLQQSWSLESKKDTKSITADWQLLQPMIAGVEVKEVKNVPKNNGYLTEIYRKDWALDNLPVEQVFQVQLFPKGISAWHTHEHTTDRLFATSGLIKVVLYDARPESPTFERIVEFKIGQLRPTLIIVPPKVWHGVQNLSDQTASLFNLVDRAYDYDSPDHWRLPMDSPKIPYKFV